MSRSVGKYRATILVSYDPPTSIKTQANCEPKLCVFILVGCFLCDEIRMFGNIFVTLTRLFRLL